MRDVCLNTIIKFSLQRWILNRLRYMFYVAVFLSCIDLCTSCVDLCVYAFRQIALAVILIRAGLGLDAEALRRLSCVVLRLAFLPCLAETLTDGIASHFILRLPWQWAFMLGYGC